MGFASLVLGLQFLYQYYLLWNVKVLEHFEEDLVRLIFSPRVHHRLILSLLCLAYAQASSTSEFSAEWYRVSLASFFWLQNINMDLSLEFTDSPLSKYLSAAFGNNGIIIVVGTPIMVFGLLTFVVASIDLYKNSSRKHTMSYYDLGLNIFTVIGFATAIAGSAYWVKRRASS